MCVSSCTARRTSKRSSVCVRRSSGCLTRSGALGFRSHFFAEFMVRALVDTQFRVRSEVFWLPNTSRCAVVRFWGSRPMFGVGHTLTFSSVPIQRSFRGHIWACAHFAGVPGVRGWQLLKAQACVTSSYEACYTLVLCFVNITVLCYGLSPCAGTQHSCRS